MLSRQLDAIQIIENQQTRSFLSGLSTLTRIEIREAALEDVIQEITIEFSSLVFLHNQSRADDCFAMLRDPLVVLALQTMEGADAELVEAKLRRDVKKWGTTVPDKKVRARGAGRPCNIDTSRNLSLFGGVRHE